MDCIDLRCGAIFVSGCSYGQVQVRGHVHTYAYTHTQTQTSIRTAGSVCSASGSFVLLSVSHNDPCTVCVCTSPNSNSVRFRPMAVQAHSEACFCESSHELGRLGLGSHWENKGQVHWEIKQNLRNVPDTFLPVFSPPENDNVLAFQSGSQRYWPHTISMAVTKTNVLWGRSWHGEFTKPVEARRPHSVTEQFIKMWLTMNSRLPVQNEQNIFSQKHSLLLSYITSCSICKMKLYLSQISFKGNLLLFIFADKPSINHSGCDCIS